MTACFEVQLPVRDDRGRGMGGMDVSAMECWKWARRASFRVFSTKRGAVGP